LLKTLSQKLIDLLKNNQGNFALVAALLLPVLFLAAGISLQYATSTNLKSRLQMAADSASLATVSRIADGGMASDDAEEFAEQIFLAQMSEDIERFDVVDLTPNPVFTETTNGGVTTWTMKIEASASFASTPLLSILGYGNMDVSVLSSATSGNEEVQGALSMGVIVDISGSMYWPIDEAAALQSILGEDRGDASRVSANLYDAFYVYGLSENQIKFVIGNYDTNDCVDLSQFASASLNGIIAIKEILLWLINTTKNLNARRYALR
jgi:Flp pilus assembly protein TadG